MLETTGVVVEVFHPYAEDRATFKAAMAKTAIYFAWLRTYAKQSHLHSCEWKSYLILWPLMYQNDAISMHMK